MRVSISTIYGMYFESWTSETTTNNKPIFLCPEQLRQTFTWDAFLESKTKGIQSFCLFFLMSRIPCEYKKVPFPCPIASHPLCEIDRYFLLENEGGLYHLMHLILQDALNVCLLNSKH